MSLLKYAEKTAEAKGRELNDRMAEQQALMESQQKEMQKVAKAREELEAREHRFETAKAELEARAKALEQREKRLKQLADSLEVASSAFRVGQPDACEKSNAVPNDGTKIRELSRWYSVNGTWASSIVAKGTPRGRVTNAHSPVAVHKS